MIRTETDELGLRQFYASRAYPEMKTYSQHGQDLWAFRTFREKSTGYFVELGAFDGVVGSNTLLLERVGWQGICIEPVGWCFDLLCENRSCVCVRALVAGKERTSALFLDSGDQMSGIADHRTYQMPTKSPVEMKTRRMVDVLRQCRAPRQIDYLSLDVEGAEVEILQDFPYAEYEVAVFTVEHNAVNFPERISVKNQMREILDEQGYRYVGDIANDGLFCMPEYYEDANRALGLHS